MQSPAARRRVIINTDAKNEADDQFAIVHALLSPTVDVRGLIAAHFGRHRSDRSMAESRQEIDLLLRLMNLSGEVPVANGAAEPIPDESTPRASPGARLIIEESKLASPATDSMSHSSARSPTWLRPSCSIRRLPDATSW
jgi:purine nucleosidase